MLKALIALIVVILILTIGLVVFVIADATPDGDDVPRRTQPG
jgi:hypothetical protein